MYNLSAIFLKCCVPWLRQEPLGHDRREIHFCRVREVRCAEQRGNMDPTPLHQGTNAVAQVPRQRSVTTRSHVPVSFRAQREKNFFDPKKLRPGQTGSFLKIPNLSPSLLSGGSKKIKTFHPFLSFKPERGGGDFLSVLRGQILAETRRGSKKKKKKRKGPVSQRS